MLNVFFYNDDFKVILHLHAETFSGTVIIYY